MFDPSWFIELLTDHPGWVAAVLFLLVFIEALVGIGYVLPAATVLLAAGALSGAGSLALLPALLGASAGAILGGHANFLLGSRLADRMDRIWPFSRYPALLEKNRDFVARHGGKSVLFGRFAKPLRPTVPAVAGMLHMDSSRFNRYNIAGSLIWVVVWIGGGWILSRVAGLTPDQAVTLSIGLLIGTVLVAILGLRLRGALGRQQGDD